MATEIIGIVGGLFFLFGFLEVSTGKWGGTSFYYETFNLLGAILLGYYSYQKHAYPNIVLNIVWGTVALYTIRQSLQRYKTRERNRVANHSDPKRTP